MREKDITLGQKVRLKEHLKFGDRIVYPRYSVGVVLNKIRVHLPMYEGYDGKPATVVRTVTVKMIDEVKPFPQEVEIYVGKLENAEYEDTKHFSCPKCGNESTGVLNIYKNNWLYCDKCKSKWLVGINLFGSWRYENDDIWKENHKKLLEYTEIE